MNTIPIVKYEGSNDTFVWKHPLENFDAGSQLFVHESQEAILFRNGQALDLFGPGKHTLETENVPLLKRIMDIQLWKNIKFHCEIYFINKVDVMEVFWGTSSPIPIQDPKYNIILPIRSNGQFTIRVEDSRKLIVKLVGTRNELKRESLTNYFRGLLMTRIKDYICTFIIEKQVSFLEVHSYLNEISEALQEQVSILYGDYGLKVVNFFVNSITVPSDDLGYIKIKDALALAKEKEILAIGKKTEMEILGYNYQQERTFDVLDKVAQNEVTGASIIEGSLGIRKGWNVEDIISESVKGGTVKTGNNEGEIKCVKCNATLKEEARFCLECGTKVENKADFIICKKCGEKSYKGRFCMNCGSRLINICAKCKIELPSESKFCFKCGEKVGD